MTKINKFLFLVVTNMTPPVKQFDDLTHSDHNYSPPSNIYEPLISNVNQPHKLSNHFSTQFDPMNQMNQMNQINQMNLLDPSAATAKLNFSSKDRNSVHSIFTQQQANDGLLSAAKSNFSRTKIDTPTNLSTVTTKNCHLNLMGSSHLNLKADLTPTNLRRRCIAKNGVANIRNAKISRKSQRFFLDFFNTMIVSRPSTR